MFISNGLSLIVFGWGNSYSAQWLKFSKRSPDIIVSTLARILIAGQITFVYQTFVGIVVVVAIVIIAPELAPAVAVGVGAGA